MKKLNLGCGKDYRKGWVNVDADKSVKADLYFDVSKKFPLKDSSFDYILAQDLLEHLTCQQAKNFLKECYRVLKPKGRLRIRIPNLFDIFKRFKNDPEVLFKFVYGDTSAHPIFGLHKWSYTKKTLEKTLARAGFRLLWIKEVETNFEAEAEKVKLPKKPLKITISSLDSGGFGGAEKFLLELSQELKNQGVQITFLTVKNSELEAHLKRGKLKRIPLPFRNDITGDIKGLIKFFALLPVSLFLYLKTLKSLKEQGFRILLISGFSDKIFLTPLAKILGFKIVWVEFAPLEFVFKKFFYLPKALYRLVKDLPDAVVVPTFYTKNKLIPQTRISEAKMRLIPCGIKILEALKRADYKRKAKKLKKKLGLEGSFVIGQVSRLQKEKGQELLLKAAALAKRKIPNLKVVIVGKGDQLDYLKELTKKLKIQKDVLFLGFWRDVYEVLGLFDVFVFPSYWKGEGFGLAPVEAEAFGIPVIAFDLPPANEVLENSAYFCNPNEKALAKAIIKLYSSPQLRRKFVLKGKKKINKYNIGNVAIQYLDVFKELYTEKLII